MFGVLLAAKDILLSFAPSWMRMCVSSWRICTKTLKTSFKIIRDQTRKKETYTQTQYLYTSMFQRRVSNREEFIMFHTTKCGTRFAEGKWLYMIFGGLGNETKAAKFIDFVYLVSNILSARKTSHFRSLFGKQNSSYFDFLVWLYRWNGSAHIER